MVSGSLTDGSRRQPLGYAPLLWGRARKPLFIAILVAIVVKEGTGFRAASMLLVPPRARAMLHQNQTQKGIFSVRSLLRVHAVVYCRQRALSDKVTYGITPSTLR